ncbi:hypothetical protein A2U01_0074933, partial [Trifolium medium]|nr:hypothetical protein [Trifolium medium]
KQEGFCHWPVAQGAVELAGAGFVFCRWRNAQTY